MCHPRVQISVRPIVASQILFVNFFLQLKIMSDNEIKSGDRAVKRKSWPSILQMSVSIFLETRLKLVPCT